MHESEFPSDDEDLVHDTFKRATDYVTYNASNMKEDDLLYLYGRYKQAVVGPCKEPKPGILYFKNRTKWSAWNSLGEMEKEEAMQQYIDKITSLNSEWDDLKTKHSAVKKHFGPVNSTCVNTDPVLSEESKTIFDHVKEGNTDKVKDLLSKDGALKCSVDEGGLSLLHWACDRGHSAIIIFLISECVDINKQDNDGQTPLHYAASCGHEDAASLLLRAGANVNIFDSDGLSPADVAYCTSMKNLLTIST